MDDDATDVFARIRAACREVARTARFVHIRDGAIAGYASSLLPEVGGTGTLDPDLHFSGRPEETLAYVVTLDTVNFGSGWFPHLRKLPGRSGYGTIATSLKRRFEDEGPISAAELAGMDRATCSSLFGQAPDGGTRDELMGLFAQALRDLGELLRARYGNSFAALIEAAGNRAARLVEILGEMTLFRDVHECRGIEIPLYKRAQIMAADLALAFEGSGPGRFEDLDRLTIFADNLVPHVLRIDGVLEYDPRLVERIVRGELLRPGSEEEVEIRACAVHAVELIVRELRALGVTDATAMQVDHVLWNRGQGADYKAHPRHRCRSVYY